jgi:hypothetical protein
VGLEVASCVALARLNVGLVTWVGACTMTTISDDTAVGPVHVTTHIKKKKKHTCMLGMRVLGLLEWRVGVLLWVWRRLLLLVWALLVLQKEREAF